jgi:hypothetical protein
MNERLQRLAERRQQLVARAAVQRAALAQHIEPWRTPLALADRGLAAVRYVRRHPGLVIGAAALLAVLRPTRAGRWLQRSWVLVSVVRKLLRA